MEEKKGEGWRTEERLIRKQLANKEQYLKELLTF